MSELEFEFTESNIRNIASSLSILKDRAEKRSLIVAQIRRVNSPDGTAHINENEVWWQWDQRCGSGCCSENETFCMPLDYLWRDDFEEHAKQSEVARKAAELAQAESEKKAQMERKEALERLEFERLKSKFTG